MEKTRFYRGVVFVDGKAQLPPNAQFAGVMFFCKESSSDEIDVDRKEMDVDRKEMDVDRKEMDINRNVESCTVW